MITRNIKVNTISIDINTIDIKVNAIKYDNINKINKWPSG
jgi:hypothetical protein